MYDQSVDFTISFALFMLLGLYFGPLIGTVLFCPGGYAVQPEVCAEKEYGKFILLILLPHSFINRYWW